MLHCAWSGIRVVHVGARVWLASKEAAVMTRSSRASRVESVTEGGGAEETSRAYWSSLDSLEMTLSQWPRSVSMEAAWCHSHWSLSCKPLTRASFVLTMVLDIQSLFLPCGLVLLIYLLDLFLVTCLGGLEGVGLACKEIHLDPCFIMFCH